ncbi:IS1 family transposase [Ammoniphilus sp. YIM 78166]|uniref:IS1 family transposase n=1 Tax=Ammoniphilus sp. YIM 78166 TaxID=1644106 RepID=UPI00106F5ADC|nr:IS1 family transposase [Ammoniphilus sp. YIM 78166]
MYSLTRLKKFFNRFMDKETCQQFLGLVKEQKQTKTLHCPHCNSLSIVRYGMYRDRQRYKCKDCSRTFNDFTNTPLHGTHFPEKWIKFLECIIEGRSLQHSAMILGVSYVTLFYWRHKIIRVLDQLEAPPIDDIRERYPEDIQYIWVFCYPPIAAVGFYECRDFAYWISHFFSIGKKYLYRYVAWFRFVERARREKGLTAMKNLLLKVCTPSIRQTYENVRVA